MHMNKSILKVVTIVGTRPEIIRLSSTIRLLDKCLNHVIVHTGQNYDYELNDIFFNDLGLRQPDYFLNIDTRSFGTVYGDTIIKAEEVLLKEKPDAVLILGDTNSAIAGIVAKRLKIPLFHMEAGNRCFDMNVPEELNRRIIDHIADFNLVYTEHARRHLIAEGLPHRRIYLTGSPMHEVILENKFRIESSPILAKLNIEKNKFFLVSAHREENVDNPQHLRSILSILNGLAEKYDLPVIVSLHPRTKKQIDKLGGYQTNKKVLFSKPFSFSDYLHLQMNACCTISDSGTICEESAILGFPAVSIRQSMERPEAQDAGSIILTGFDFQVVMESISLVMEEYIDGSKAALPPEYSVSNTSWRVLKLIMGNAKLSNRWWGINQ
jgi:UDP-N-acetyl-L-fucosamine synthase